MQASIYTTYHALQFPALTILVLHPLPTSSLLYNIICPITSPIIYFIMLALIFFFFILLLLAHPIQTKFGSLLVPSIILFSSLVHLILSTL